MPQLSYNEYLFDGATYIEVSVEPIYDDTGRTIVAYRYTTEFKCLDYQLPAN